MPQPIRNRSRFSLPSYDPNPKNRHTGNAKLKRSVSWCVMPAPVAVDADAVNQLEVIDSEEHGWLWFRSQSEAARSTA